MSFSITSERAIAPRARTLLDIFTATVVRCGDRPAIDAPDAVLSYRGLDAAAGVVAARLRGLGIGPGDRVAVQVRSGTSELYVAILGVLKAGAGYVPIEADDPPTRAADVVERSAACAVIRDGHAIERVTRPRGQGRPVRVDDEAWVIFTSGSTGAPKGVAVSHRSAAAFVDAEARLWSIERTDRVLAGLSVAFDASCEEMWLAWRHGAALVPAPREVVRAGAELGPWLAERRVTVVSTVPTLAAMWDEVDLRGVRLLILGGEACPESLGWRLAAGREVWNTYGPTEATVVTTAARIEPGRPVTIGWPLDGWEAAVVDEAGEPVSEGQAGELVIAGVGVARYLDPVLDVERFPPLPALGWERAYPSGDVVRETADGFVFVGRRDHQVKIGGRRIELGEIDARLSALLDVRAAVTVVRESRAGNKLLVAYVVADAAPAEIRAAVAEHLPQALVPTIVPVNELPTTRSGKIDRAALPWPPPAEEGVGELSHAAAWLAERWRDQLGPVEITPASDFFELGGTSLAAAKLVSVVRERFPAVAVADLYEHRRFAALTRRLEALSGGEPPRADEAVPPARRWGALQLAGVFMLLVLAVPAWLLGLLTLDQISPSRLGPRVGWAALIGGWLVFVSAPGRALIAVAARRVLLGGVTPGRHPRHGWLALRIWFLERLAEAYHLDALAGTPWAARYARLMGHRVGQGARLETVPPPSALITIGAGATLEPDVDLHGWWIDGRELVIGELWIGAGARVGTRSLLMPGARIGAGAEVEPGTVITGEVPAGQRFTGSPGRLIGAAGDKWPEPLAAVERLRPAMKALYAAGLGVQNLIPLLASLPGLGLAWLLMAGHWTASSLAVTVLRLAPVLALAFVVSSSLLAAVAVRSVSRWIRPGWHPDSGAVAWALWFTDSIMAGTRGALFPLYATVYTRAWLRLLGIRVGKRTEVSTAVGLNRLTRVGEHSFAADDVVFACAERRGGWIHVAPIEVGDRTFMGNSAILPASTRLGHDSLVGALTTAPRMSKDGTSWFGMPPLQLPRIAEAADPARTHAPSRRRIVARGATEMIRILLPGSVSTVLGALMFWALLAIGRSGGLAAMLAFAPVLLAAGGVSATLVTVAIKWVLIGRYAPGRHPLWSFFVWRDEIVNSCQEELAGAWLLRAAIATPLLSCYLRLMGASVGRDVWCESLNLTEFDVATLGDGCVINRGAVVETHLFHDRVLSIGPARLGAGATLGPATAMLPDSDIGAQCRVGGRSVVMRGEQLPAGTSWHGAPVVADAGDGQSSEIGRPADGAGVVPVRT